MTKTTMKDDYICKTAIPMASDTEAQDLLKQIQKQLVDKYGLDSNDAVALLKPL